MYKGLEVLLKCCSIFGIYVPQPRYHSRKLRVVITLYMLFLVALIGVNCVLGITLFPVTDDYVISWFVSVVVFLSQMLTHLVIIWEALAKQQEHNDFLRQLNDIEFAFKLRLRVEFARPEVMQQLKRTVVILAVTSIAGLVIFAVNTSFFSDSGHFWWAIVAILAMRIRFLQLLVYVELLCNFLLTLNQSLNQVVSLKTEQSKQLLDIDYKDLYTMEYLNNIKDLYSCIYKSFHYLNEFAQASMFAATASYFLDFTCHIYWTLLALDNLLSVYSIISAASTIIPLGLNIFRFCYMCQLVKQECHRTSLMVTRLMVSNSDYPCVEYKRNYRSLLYDFSLQLMHQRIEVTGKRFFNFDLKCIFAICALIMTHLIILIQFTKSDGNQIVAASSNITTERA